jgi:hypothetical protein
VLVVLAFFLVLHHLKLRWWTPSSSLSIFFIPSTFETKTMSTLVILFFVGSYKTMTMNWKLIVVVFSLCKPLNQDNKLQLVILVFFHYK